ncbi:MAG: leishmanolysin-related zinc metalloendopeptidase [Gemmatales bacterium]
MPVAPRRTLQQTTKLLLESLEERLTPAWASVPIAVLPTLPATSMSLTQNDLGDVSMDGDISSDSEIDWYSITSLSTGAAVFQVTTPNSSLDTVMAIYKSNKARLQFSDNISPSNTDSRFTVNLVKDQTYYLGITKLNGSLNGSYTLKIDGTGKTKLPADDRYENNDTQATAYNVGSLTSEKSFTNLVMADGEDWFRFTLPTAGSSTSLAAIYFDNSQGDLDLELYDTNGSVIRSSSSAGDQEEFSLEGLPAGNYFVRVFGETNPAYNMVLSPKLAQGAPGFTIQLRMAGLSVAQQSIFYQAAFRWSSIITSDLPNARYQGVNVDDLLIEATAANIDGPGGVLGQAAPDRFRGNDLPYHGFMEFDKADLLLLQNSGQLLSVVLHEMGHVLGIGTIWDDLGLLSGPGTDNPSFTGPQATAAYNSIFGTSLTGVPVENTGGTGTRESHWRESILKNELMTGYLNTGSNPLSRITVASLADLGYTVNINKADNYNPPASSLLAAPGGSDASLVGAAIRLADLDAGSPLAAQPARPALAPAALTSNATRSMQPSLQQTLAADTLFSVNAGKPAKRTASVLNSKISTKL